MDKKLLDQVVHWMVDPETQKKDMKALWTTALQDAHDKAISVDPDEPLMIVWTKHECRAFSLNEDNFHWSCPSLRFPTIPGSGEAYSIILR